MQSLGRRYVSYFNETCRCGKVSPLDRMLPAAGYGVNIIITDDFLDGTRDVPRSWVAEMKSTKPIVS